MQAVACATPGEDRRFIDTEPPVKERERRRSYLLAALTLLIVVTAIEVIGRVGLLVVPSLIGMPSRTAREILREQTERIGRLLAPDSLRREEIDAELGWRYRAGFSKGTDYINRQGTRNLRVYASSPPSEAIRVAVFGDSFVYGNEVGTADSSPTQLELGDPLFEVPNYGVG